VGEGASFFNQSSIDKISEHRTVPCKMHQIETKINEENRKCLSQKRDCKWEKALMSLLNKDTSLSKHERHDTNMAAMTS